MANSHTEGEDRMSLDNQEMAESEHEEAHEKEISKEEAIRSYLEDKKEEKEEEKKRLEKAKGHTLIEERKYGR